MAHQDSEKFLKNKAELLVFKISNNVQELLDTLYLLGKKFTEKDYPESEYISQLREPAIREIDKLYLKTVRKLLDASREVVTIAVDSDYFNMGRFL